MKFRSHIGWKQDNIFSARLGLTEEAAKYNTMKMANSERRFPAFWGPGFDWVPDHNWGGSGMIGMQEMLLQEADGKIYLFPAWPKDWDVQFKVNITGREQISGNYTQQKGLVLEKFNKNIPMKIVHNQLLPVHGSCNETSIFYGTIL